MREFFERLDPATDLQAVFDRLEAAGTKLRLELPDSSYKDLKRAFFDSRAKNRIECDNIQLQNSDGKMHIRLVLTDLTEDQLAQICAIIR